MPSVYESMTAQELHEIVTRLEAKGFKAPMGVKFDDGTWKDGAIPIRTSFAAAIIEVAARDWWLGTGDCVISTHSTGETYAEDFMVPSLPQKSPTPLHAIAAAVEAK